MTGRQGFVLTVDCKTNSIYHFKTNSNVGPITWNLWQTYTPASNGIVRFIDENYASDWGKPWLENTADTSRFYMIEVQDEPQTKPLK
jgi:hypothetical protein